MAGREAKLRGRGGWLPAVLAVLCLALAVSACGRTVVRAEGSPSDFNWSVGLQF